MAADSEVTWLVGRAEELGVLSEQLEPIDATVQETWPAEVSSGIVALVRAAPTDADTAADALGPETQRFHEEGPAREAAEEVARTSTEELWISADRQPRTRS